MMQAEKFQGMKGLIKNRLKGSSFVHGSKKLSGQFHDRLPQSTLPFFSPDMPESWVSDITDIKVHTTVPSLSGGDTQDDTVKQSLTLAMIAERYPQEAWIHVFSDGSATDSLTNGRAGILVYFPGGQKASASMTVGKHCSNYRAEKEAIIQAASIVQASDHDCKQVYSSLTPSPSRQHIKTTSSKTWPKPYNKLQLPGRLFYSGFQPTVEYQEMSKWTSLHRRVPENSMPTISASVKRRLSLTALTMPRSQRDDYHPLSRKQQVILVRLRHGHNRLNSHVYGKLKLAPSPTCPCGQEDQTTEHVLQRCPLHKATREDV